MMEVVSCDRTDVGAAPTLVMELASDDGCQRAGDSRRTGDSLRAGERAREGDKLRPVAVTCFLEVGRGGDRLSLVPVVAKESVLSTLLVRRAALRFWDRVTRSKALEESGD